MSIFTRKRGYITPDGDLYRLYDIMAEQTHLLIAGATGSGKSVIINGIIFNLLHTGPAENQLILLDPKRTELSDYRRLPHCLQYATEPAEMISALKYALKITEERYKIMQRRREKMWSGGHVYVIIDELAFIMVDKNIRKQALPIMQQLGMIARASAVHMIAATQTIKADVLPTTLTCNFDSRVALRTSNAQQSRMIIDAAGCECFPSPRAEHRALAYFRSGADITLYNVPMYSESQVASIVSYWQSKKCIA